MARHDVNIRIGAKDHASKVFKRVAIAAGAFLSMRQFGRAAKHSLNLFAEQEKATQKLSQAIKATGGACGYTTHQMREYAAELQNMTTISNESYETAIGVMATFRNVSGETFKRSIRLAADMSVQFGSLESATVMVGKALNDPIIGLTAMQRVGITFSLTQKELIKQFVEQNNLLGAQKVMLDELQNQFGGQAKKAVEGYAGSVDQLKNSWDDAVKSMGKAMATDQILDMQGNIRLSTILIENMGLTWELVTKTIKLSVLEVGDNLSKLVPLTRLVMAIGGRGKEDPIDRLRREQLKIQETLGQKLTDRLLALYPPPDPKSRKKRMIEEAFVKARLSAELTAGKRPAITLPLPPFPTDEEFEARLRGGGRRQRVEGLRRIEETRESINLQKKEGNRSDKVIELQEEMLRALENAPVMQVTDFN